MPPAPFSRDGVAFADSTVRQTVRVTLGGQRIRLRLSNAYGTAGLPVTAVYVALPRGGHAGASAIQPGTSRSVTFGSRPGVSIPAGDEVVSDPLDVSLEPGANLTVTMYLARGQASGGITGHPGSRTTSYIAAGNHGIDQDPAWDAAVEHWYFVGGVEVCPAPAAAAVAILGDSLTDGRGSTTDGNDRWPDRLFTRLQSAPATSRIAVLNQGIGGNRVLSDGPGPSVLARLEHDVLSYGSVRWLIIFAGVNDIGSADATQPAQHNVADGLIAAYSRMIRRARARRIMVAGATLTPFGGHSAYDDPQGHREAGRQAFNHWIRASHEPDAILDFDRAVRDPASPQRLLAPFDCGDHLHLSPAGYQALAEAVPVPWFRAP
jgi:lysophospholipase L1-like esterase